MSIVACAECGCYIDSDENPECWDIHDKPYCDNCRDEGQGHYGKDYTKQVEAMLNNPPENDDG